MIYFYEQINYSSRNVPIERGTPMLPFIDKKTTLNFTDTNEYSFNSISNKRTVTFHSKRWVGEFKGG